MKILKHLTYALYMKWAIASCKVIGLDHFQRPVWTRVPVHPVEISYTELIKRGIFVDFKGCGMGPWLVLVSPCFGENVVATYKIGSFLCSLDTLLQKNVIVLFFGNQISKWRSFEKRAIFDLLFIFSSNQGEVTKIPSAHISFTYIHVFCSPY